MCLAGSDLRNLFWCSRFWGFGVVFEGLAAYIPQLEEGVFLDFRRAKLQGLKLLR